MSLSNVPNLVTSWIEAGLPWHMDFQPHKRPFTLAAGEMRQIPSGQRTFKASEGVLEQFAAFFDHPSCGIRAELTDDDTEATFTVQNIAGISGYTNQPYPVIALVPPSTAPGYYGIAWVQQYPWLEFCRLYVFNSATVAHTCMAYGYTIYLLDKARS